MNDQTPPAAATDAIEDSPPMTGARNFVTVVFVLLGLSFLLHAGLLLWEFRALDWPALLLLHSHLFIFFPTFGILALVAFHLPATVFTDMYWRHIPHGRLRFIIGTVVVVAASVFFSLFVDKSNPGEVWQVAPSVLLEDRSQAVSCEGEPRSCVRVPLLAGVSRLRDEAQLRLGMSKFARACQSDPLLEEPAEIALRRYCFPAGGLLPGHACCDVQKAYAKRIATLVENGADRSLTGRAEVFVLPLETFFVIVVVVIGLLLVIWRKLLEAKYVAIAPAIERALLIGAAAMMPWPLMDYAYAQAMETLAGRHGSGLGLRLSLVVGPWALLLLVFFLARMGRKIERLGQLAGAVASVLAVLRYEQLNDVAVRYLGVGAPLWMAVVLAAYITVCLMSLRWPRHLQRGINTVIGRHPDIGMGPPPGFKR